MMRAVAAATTPSGFESKEAERTAEAAASIAHEFSKHDDSIRGVSSGIPPCPACAAIVAELQSTQQARGFTLLSHAYSATARTQRASNCRDDAAASTVAAAGTSMATTAAAAAAAAASAPSLIVLTRCARCTLTLTWSASQLLQPDAIICPTCALTDSARARTAEATRRGAVAIPSKHASAAAATAAQHSAAASSAAAIATAAPSSASVRSFAPLPTSAASSAASSRRDAIVLIEDDGDSGFSSEDEPIIRSSSAATTPTRPIAAAPAAALPLSRRPPLFVSPRRAIVRPDGKEPEEAQEHEEGDFEADEYVDDEDVAVVSMLQRKVMSGATAMRQGLATAAAAPTTKTTAAGSRASPIELDDDLPLIPPPRSAPPPAATLAAPTTTAAVVPPLPASAAPPPAATGPKRFATTRSPGVATPATASLSIAAPFVAAVAAAAAATVPPLTAAPPFFFSPAPTLRPHSKTLPNVVVTRPKRKAVPQHFPQPAAGTAAAADATSNGTPTDVQQQQPPLKAQKNEANTSAGAAAPAAASSSSTAAAGPAPSVFSSTSSRAAHRAAVAATRAAFAESEAAAASSFFKSFVASSQTPISARLYRQQQLFAASKARLDLRRSLNLEPELPPDDDDGGQASGANALPFRKKQAQQSRADAAATAAAAASNAGASVSSFTLPAFFRAESTARPYTNEERLQACEHMIATEKSTQPKCRALCLPNMNPKSWPTIMHKAASSSGSSTAAAAAASTPPAAPTAPSALLSHHYRRLAKLVHPDKCAPQIRTQAETAFKILHEAYTQMTKLV